MREVEHCWNDYELTQWARHSAASLAGKEEDQLRPFPCYLLLYFGLFFDFNWLLVCGLWAGMHRDRKTMKAQNSQS